MDTPSYAWKWKQKHRQLHEEQPFKIKQDVDWGSKRSSSSNTKIAAETEGGGVTLCTLMTSQGKHHDTAWRQMHHYDPPSWAVVSICHVHYYIKPSRPWTWASHTADHIHLLSLSCDAKWRSWIIKGGPVITACDARAHSFLLLQNQSTFINVVHMLCTLSAFNYASKNNGIQTISSSDSWWLWMNVALAMLLMLAVIFLNSSLFF